MTKVNDEKRWYVLITKPKAEKRVSEQLTAAGIENYLPLHRQLRVWHDRKKWVEIPLFGPYVFVFIENNFRNKVFTVNGVVRYLSIAGKISTIQNSEIAQIEKLCSYLGNIEVERDIFSKGDEVEIISGHFAGVRGEIISINDEFKFRIAIPGIGCSATVSIEKAQVIKA